MQGGILGYALAFAWVMATRKLSDHQRKIYIKNRTKDILRSAYQSVPYYREVMKATGYNPMKDYTGPEDLRLIPVLKKEIIHKKGSAAFTQEGADFSKCFTDSTSGSTGIPLKYYQTHFEQSIAIAKWLRVFFANGYSPFQKVMALVAPKRVKRGTSWIQRLGILRRKAVNYVESPPEEMFDILLSYKPDVLYGNRSHLDMMAMELRKRGVDPKSLNLKLLIGTAEVIRERNRALYRQAFGVEVIESYGCVEIGVMAYETPERNGLRLCDDCVYFEFLNENDEPASPGELARVVVTDLTKKLMPFIRYGIGDWAIFEYVSGSKAEEKHRVIKRIVGRDNELIPLPNATSLSVHELEVTVEKYNAIDQFRVIQVHIDEYEILLATSVECFHKILDELLEDLRSIGSRHGCNLNFRVTRVNQIPPDETGKTRTFISLLDK